MLSLGLLFSFFLPFCLVAFLCVLIFHFFLSCCVGCWFFLFPSLSLCSAWTPKAPPTMSCLAHELWTGFSKNCHFQLPINRCSLWVFSFHFLYPSFWLFFFVSSCSFFVSLLLRWLLVLSFPLTFSVQLGHQRPAHDERSGPFTVNWLFQEPPAVSHSPVMHRHFVDYKFKVSSQIFVQFLPQIAVWRFSHCSSQACKWEWCSIWRAPPLSRMLGELLGQERSVGPGARLINFR